MTELQLQAKRAREAWRILAVADRAQKDAALHAMADCLKEHQASILSENAADIEAAKKPFADYDTIKTQLDEAQKTIKGFQDQDIDGVRRAASDWEQKYNQAIADHKEQMEAMAFEAALKDAITAAGGRSVAAIKGELEDQIAALRTSKNQTQDIASAIEGLKKNSAYLFGADKTPPNFSPNTGSPLGSQGSGTFNFGFQGIRPRETEK